MWQNITNAAVLWGRAKRAKRGFQIDLLEVLAKCLEPRGAL